MPCRAALAVGAVCGSAWVMTPGHALARRHGGPLDGDLVEAPWDQWRMPVDVIGLPVPVLDEGTLPGYPTYSKDVPESRCIEST